jgi:hypothetical protein
MRDRRVGPRSSARAFLRATALALVTLLYVLVSGATAGARETEDVNSYVKYYVVQTSYRGQPERLSDIAARFLGSGERSADIFALNADRTQPDGQRLTDPGKLEPGWVLILPWDAVGEGVVYGTLPAPPVPTRGPATGTNPPRTKEDCTAAARDNAAAPPWAQLRLAPDQAWPLSKGEGVTVALMGSTAPVASPALAGRVTTAVDVTSGTGDGVDCPGRETAMAGIIGAKPRSGTKMVGMAPKATILPVVMNVARGSVKAADLAQAVSAAVAAGADVVAVPVPVDLADPIARAAVDRAVSHGAVVLVPAPTAGGPGSRIPGVLRVAGIGADDRLLGDYVPGGADVLAPGRHVDSLAADGLREAERSGTDLAVAFVAGLAALVMATAPDLSAVEVARVIRATADSRGSAPRRSLGVINPEAAVKATATDAPASGSVGPDDLDRSGPALLVALLAVVSLTTALRLWGPGRGRIWEAVRRRLRLAPRADQMTGEYQ